MLRTLVAFVPVAVLVTITPGPATAMVVRSAARGGRRAFVEGPWARRVERLTGAVLVALGVRLALERR